MSGIQEGNQGKRRPEVVEPKILGSRPIADGKGSTEIVDQRTRTRPVVVEPRKDDSIVVRSYKRAKPQGGKKKKGK